ncbi:hypothetical protein, partial [Salmonella sp. SAL4358]|uniref:hypothetical protein n=1 Tax=Salmonella sp. SAL4358 TaxID=3159879 RepID=UPI003977F2BB
ELKQELVAIEKKSDFPTLLLNLARILGSKATEPLIPAELLFPIYQIFSSPSMQKHRCQEAVAQMVSALNKEIFAHLLQLLVCYQ